MMNKLLYTLVLILGFYTIISVLWEFGKLVYKKWWMK